MELINFNYFRKNNIFYFFIITYLRCQSLIHCDEQAKDKIYMHVNYFHAQNKIEHRNGVKTVTIVITLP